MVLHIRLPFIVLAVLGLAFASLGCAAGGPARPAPTVTVAPTEMPLEEGVDADLARFMAAEDAPELEIVAEVPWQPLYTGDPLLLRVRLASPRAQQEILRQALQQKQGEAESTPAFMPPEVAPSWVSGVNLKLCRVADDGACTPVLAGADWATHQLQPEASPPEAVLNFSGRSQEWLVPSTALELSEGKYVLQVSWVGKGLVDEALLGPGGMLRGVELALEVRAPASASENADHTGRLAYGAYQRGDYEQARTLGREALRLDSHLSQERIETYFLVAGASVSLQDYDAAATTYRELVDKLSPEQADVAAVAQQWLNVVEGMKKGQK